MRLEDFEECFLSDFYKVTDCYLHKLLTPNLKLQIKQEIHSILAKHAGMLGNHSNLLRINVLVVAGPFGDLTISLLVDDRVINDTKDLYDILCGKDLGMIPFKTTPEEIKNLYKIAGQMDSNGVDLYLITDVIKYGRTDQGIYNLAELWERAMYDHKEQFEIISDLQECINDYKKEY